MGKPCKMQELAAVVALGQLQEAMPLAPGIPGSCRGPYYALGFRV